MKTLFLFVVIGVLCVYTFPSFSQTPGEADAGLEITEAGNTTCPVSGEKVAGKYFASHKDVRYGFCCRGCIRKFEKHPEKYLRNLEEKDEGPSGEKESPPS